MFKRDIVEVYLTLSPSGVRTWRWRLLDGHNHQIVANSAEWYTDKGHTIKQARKRNPLARLQVKDN